LFSCNEAVVFRNGSSGDQLCRVPSEVHERAEQRGMMLLSEAPTHVVYGELDGAEEDAALDGVVDEFSFMVYDCAQQKELIFLHIPKNAGTTIENIANHEGVKLGRFRNNYKHMWESGAPQKMPDGNACSWWHVPPALKAPPNPYADPNAEVFCVVRDPWLRMRSEYMYLLKEYYRWPKPFVKDGPPCTSLGFNMWASKTLRQVQAGQPYVLDCHMLPQWSYIQGADGRMWCDTPIPITDLTPRFNALMESRGLPVRMAPHNKANSAASQCPELTDVPVKEMFSKATKVLMRQVFAPDFLNLGFEEEPGNVHFVANQTSFNRSKHGYQS
jgi:hypothetical protein